MKSRFVFAGKEEITIYIIFFFFPLLFLIYKGGVKSSYDVSTVADYFGL